YSWSGDLYNFSDELMKINLFIDKMSYETVVSGKVQFLQSKYSIITFILILASTYYDKAWKFAGKT
ncbi:MAG: hypothetical protein ACTSU9_16165, partial [Promethearchaeota archaeon]